MNRHHAGGNLFSGYVQLGFPRRILFRSDLLITLQIHCFYGWKFEMRIKKHVKFGRIS